MDLMHTDICVTSEIHAPLTSDEVKHRVACLTAFWFLQREDARCVKREESWLLGAKEIPAPWRYRRRVIHWQRIRTSKRKITPQPVVTA